MQKAFVVYKLSGAGNTFAFAFVDACNELYLNRRQLVRRVCSPLLGISCDGFVFLEQNSNGWTWDFYNSDGSNAEMCGNAARCAMLFIRDILSLPVKNLALSTKSGTIIGNDVSLVEGESTNQFEIEMTHHFKILKETQVKLHNIYLYLSLIDTGVPHLVFVGSQLDREESSKLRHDRSLSADGANVTSYKLKSPDHIAAVTYERGVEDFTLACGTGAVAAALDYWRKSDRPEQSRWIRVDMPGGILKVFCTKDDKPLMRGPAEFLLQAKFNEEYL
jgi:diaminopimelate epimerase